jgi:hypothetical protein
MATTYRFDVFQLNVTATGEVATAADVMRTLHEREEPVSAQVGEYTRELWRTHQVRTPSGAWSGQFRKFRTVDLPHIGAPGEEEEELDIDPTKGIVERNFFLLVPPHNILLWQVNGHGNTPQQFARFLSSMAGTEVVADPVLLANPMRRLMRGGLTIKRIRLRVARPTNVDYYPEEDWSREVFDVLRNGGGDSMLVEVSMDGRKAETAQTAVDSKWRRAFREFVNDGVATSAVAEVIEDGDERVIDLLGDRLESRIEVDFDGRYVPATVMVSALQAAWDDVDGAIEEMFGSGQTALHR